eukprot:1181955-Prorocentrum_minimum.AAC.1
MPRSMWPVRTSSMLSRMYDLTNSPPKLAGICTRRDLSSILVASASLSKPFPFPPFHTIPVSVHTTSLASKPYLLASTQHPIALSTHTKLLSILTTPLSVHTIGHTSAHTPPPSPASHLPLAEEATNVAPAGVCSGRPPPPPAPATRATCRGSRHHPPTPPPAPR